jgi:2-dehydro-3-deoxyphosphogluconate aldolase/(4S)-4-hydroxy-2-oxoglutarate aldolase
MAKHLASEVYEKIAAVRLLPLFNYADVEICKGVIRACYEAGVLAFELTNRDETALEVFKKLVPFAASECPGLSLGAGTILAPITAQKYIDAGADFIIAPNLDLAVGETCVKQGIPWIPGCFTPTEIQLAYQHGAHYVKLFPAATAGPAYIKHLKGPMPWVKIVVTGGVLLDEVSVQSWIDAGVIAIGVGSQLFSRAFIETKDYTAIRLKMADLVALTRAV